MKKRNLIIVGVIILVLVGIILFSRFREDSWICENGKWVKHGNPSSEIPSYSCDNNIIGGERDEHGCLGAAGYSWNETEKECVREWEINEERYQITDFRSCADAGYSIMESYPRQCKTLSGKQFTE